MSVGFHYLILLWHFLRPYWTVKPPVFHEDVPLSYRKAIYLFLGVSFTSQGFKLYPGQDNWWPYYHYLSSAGGMLRPICLRQKPNDPPLLSWTPVEISIFVNHNEKKKVTKRYSEKGIYIYIYPFVWLVNNSPSREWNPEAWLLYSAVFPFYRFWISLKYTEILSVKS